jgi:hypothetical protein
MVCNQTLRRAATAQGAARSGDEGTLVDPEIQQNERQSRLAKRTEAEGSLSVVKEGVAFSYDQAATCSTR